jgi:hypothetical protein
MCFWQRRAQLARAGWHPPSGRPLGQHRPARGSPTEARTISGSQPKPTARRYEEDRRRAIAPDQNVPFCAPRPQHSRHQQPAKKSAICAAGATRDALGRRHERALTVRSAMHKLLRVARAGSVSGPPSCTATQESARYPPTRGGRQVRALVSRRIPCCCRLRLASPSAGAGLGHPRYGPGPGTGRARAGHLD